MPRALAALVVQLSQPTIYAAPRSALSPANIPTPSRRPQGLRGLSLSFSLVRSPTGGGFWPLLPQTCGLTNTREQSVLRSTPIRRSHRRRCCIRGIPSVRGRTTTPSTPDSIPINNAASRAQPGYRAKDRIAAGPVSANGPGPTYAPAGGRPRQNPTSPVATARSIGPHHEHEPRAVPAWTRSAPTSHGSQERNTGASARRS